MSGSNSHILTIKSIDVLIQLGIYVFFIIWGWEDVMLKTNNFYYFSAIFFLTIGAYQVFSYLIHLFTFKRPARLSLYRKVYFTIATLSLCVGYYAIYLGNVMGLEKSIYLLFHSISIFYLALSLKETVRFFDNREKIST